MFLRNEFDRNSDDIKNLKIEKEKILMRLNKIKKDVFILTDIIDLNRQF